MSPPQQPRTVPTRRPGGKDSTGLTDAGLTRVSTTIAFALAGAGVGLVLGLLVLHIFMTSLAGDEEFESTAMLIGAGIGELVGAAIGLLVWKGRRSSEDPLRLARDLRGAALAIFVGGLIAAKLVIFADTDQQQAPFEVVPVRVTILVLGVLTALVLVLVARRLSREVVEDGRSD